MSLATGECKKDDSHESRLTLGWAVQLALSILGCAFFLWLAHRTDFNAIHPLPTFAERLRQVQTPLIEFLVGMLFLSWALFVISARKQLKAEALQANSAAPEIENKKLSKRVRWMLFAVYMLAATFLMGGEFNRFLWPSHDRAIAFLSLAVIGLFGIVGPVIKQRGQKTRISLPADEGYVKREPLVISTPALVVIVLVAGAAAVFGIHYAAKNYYPAYASKILIIGTVIVSSVVFFLVSILQRPDEDESSRCAARLDKDGNETREGFRRRMRRTTFYVLYSSALLLVLISPLRSQIKTAIFYGQFLALFPVAYLVLRVKRWIYQVGHSGNFERALRLDRKWSLLPFYGESLQGMILFNAGRYSEAREFLKPLAFDAQGKPRLASTELYAYALALENDGHEQEAQELLEAAVPVSKKPEAMQVALATCLLAQDKETDRACKLLEQAQASTRGLLRADLARRIARYAWALGACKRRQEAELKIQEALAKGAGLGNADLAGVHYFVGEAWRALGDMANARAAFQEAVRLAPDGVTALSVRKALAKMGGTWHVWPSEA
jgi:tetratricopeptide (TPR) repeat protein